MARRGEACGCPEEGRDAREGAETVRGEEDAAECAAAARESAGGSIMMGGDSSSLDQSSMMASPSSAAARGDVGSAGGAKKPSESIERSFSMRRVIMGGRRERNAQRSE